MKLAALPFRLLVCVCAAPYELGASATTSKLPLLSSLEQPFSDAKAGAALDGLSKKGLLRIGKNRHCLWGFTPGSRLQKANNSHACYIIPPWFVSFRKLPMEEGCGFCSRSPDEKMGIACAQGLPGLLIS
jgi:hypothetical protein